MVEELRVWAATQDLDPTMQRQLTLATVQPGTYFNLTCQLLARAPLDPRRTLLKVTHLLQTCPLSSLPLQ